MSLDKQRRRQLSEQYTQSLRPMGIFQLLALWLEKLQPWGEGGDNSPPRTR